MIRLNSIFFLLFLLFITGGFAAIARNSYGITLLGWTTAGFAFFCVIGAIISKKNSKGTILSFVEFLTITVISGIASMRIFFIHFQYVEVLFSIAAIALFFVYVLYIVNDYKTLSTNNFRLFITTALVYASIAVYTVSIGINHISNRTSLILGILGFMIIVLAFIMKYRVKTIVIKEKEVSLFQYLSLQSNRSVLLISIYVLLTFYSAGQMAGIIPDIQSSTMPKGYYELVKKAENGEDENNEGKYQYKHYQERLENFMTKRGFKN